MIKTLLLSIIILCFTAGAAAGPAVASEKWQGVDEAVGEKIAKENGREVREPLLNTDQGDLLQFLFLVAGATGGFAAGYFWRMLTERKKEGDRKAGNAFP